jgi:hypothetical protein
MFIIQWLMGDVRKLISMAALVAASELDDNIDTVPLVIFVIIHSIKLIFTLGNQHQTSQS